MAKKFFFCWAVREKGDRSVALYLTIKISWIIQARTSSTTCDSEPSIILKSCGKPNDSPCLTLTIFRKMFHTSAQPPQDAIPKFYSTYVCSFADTFQRAHTLRSLYHIFMILRDVHEHYWKWTTGFNEVGRSYIRIREKFEDLWGLEHLALVPAVRPA